MKKINSQSLCHLLLGAGVHPSPWPPAAAAAPVRCGARCVRQRTDISGCHEPWIRPTLSPHCKVYTWWDVTKFEHLQKMKSDFEAENPDIKLEFVTIPSQYADTMVTKLAGGEIPDVMMLAMDQVPRYALNGMLLPLDDLASQEYKDSLCTPW
ncbi:MAG: extracellular solute-binding protein [Ruthenibacterium lactatiformans]